MKIDLKVAEDAAARITQLSNKIVDQFAEVAGGLKGIDNNELVEALGQDLAKMEQYYNDVFLVKAKASLDLVGTQIPELNAAISKLASNVGKVTEKNTEVKKNNIDFGVFN